MTAGICAQQYFAFNNSQLYIRETPWKRVRMRFGTLAVKKAYSAYYNKFCRRYLLRHIRTWRSATSRLYDHIPWCWAFTHSTPSTCAQSWCKGGIRKLAHFDHENLKALGVCLLCSKKAGHVKYSVCWARLQFWITLPWLWVTLVFNISHGAHLLQNKTYSQFVHCSPISHGIIGEIVIGPGNRVNVCQALNIFKMKQNISPDRNMRH